MRNSLWLCVGLLFAGFTNVYGIDIQSTPMENASPINADFKTTEQSLCNGSVEPRVLELVDLSTSQTYSLGRVITVKTYLEELGKAGDVIAAIPGLDKSLGGQITGTINSGLGFNVKIEDIGCGDVSVDYPVTVFLKYPSPNQFGAGDTVLIKSSYNANSGSQITTSPTTGNLSLINGININLDPTAKAEICLGSCTSENLFPALELDEEVTLLSVDSDGGTGGLFEYINEYCPDNPPNEENGKYTFSSCHEDQAGVSGWVQFPKLASQSTIIGPDDGLLSGTVRTKFSKMTLDLDFWATKLLSLKLPKSKYPNGVSFEGEHEVGGSTIAYNIIDQEIDFEFYETRSVEFDPTVQVQLNMNTSMQYCVLDECPVDENDPVACDPTNSSTGSVVTFNAGQCLALTLPDDRNTPINTDSSSLLDNKFTHESKIETELTGTIKALSFDFEVGSYEIWGGGCVLGGPCCGNPLDKDCWDWCCYEELEEISYDESFGLGPLWTPPDTNLDERKDQFLPSFTETYELPGFSAINGPGFEINPENPAIKIVKEVSNVINNGRNDDMQMSRTVTYAINVANDGDVPLTDVQVLDSLEEAFPVSDFYGYKIGSLQSCDLATALNTLGTDGYDGSSFAESFFKDVVTLDDGGREVDAIDVNEIPSPGPGLIVPESGLIVLQATVTPKPYPSVSTNQVEVTASSYPRGTSLEDTSSVSLNLGPAEIDHLDDFVLFADHKVNLQDSGFIRGTIGSNNAIEAQYGVSGNIAGDLRALGVIDVHGTMNCDYIYSGQWVNVSENGRLNGKGFDEYSSLPEVSEYVAAEQIPEWDLSLLPFVAGGDNLNIKGGVPSSPILITPGTYGKFDIAAKSYVKLVSGNYTFETMSIGKSAVLMFDVASGPITINLVKAFNVSDQVNMSISTLDGSTRNVIWNILAEGHIRIGQESAIVGIFQAPNSKVTFDDRSSLKGAFYAENLTLKEGVTAEYHNDWSGELYKLINVECASIADDL